MRKKIVASLLLMMFGMGSATVDAGLFNWNWSQNSDCCEPCDPCDPCQSNKWAITQVGIAFEDRQNFADFYLYANQLIKDNWFWEVRLLGIRSFIVTAPPTLLAPALPISVKDERNQNGIGTVAILGYVWKLNSKVSIMPFFRFQAYQNATGAYKDKFHNKINTWSLFYFGGLRLNMKVTDDFGIYAQYFGGYERTMYKTKGFFATNGKHFHVNQLQGTFEFGCPYKFCKSWYATPYIQLVVTDNNPGKKALGDPLKATGLTTFFVTWAMRLGYEF
jgi:hypothetical protein